MTRRQMAAMETRRKLVDSARRIIFERGLAGTSIDEICAGCGVSKGTFYVYFKRKEDVVYELSHTAFPAILETAKSHQGTLQERLSFFMTEFTTYIAKGGLKLCQEWVRNTSDPGFAGNEEGKEKLRLDVAAVRELLEAAVDGGELKPEAPAGLLASTLVDVLYGEMLSWVTSDGAFDFPARTGEFCRTFLEAFLKPYLNH